MPSISESTEQQHYLSALKQSKIIPWEEIVQLNNILGGEIRFRGRPKCVRQGIVSNITLEGKVVSIFCPWLLETPLDDEGDPVGDYMKEQWKVIDQPREIRITVSKSLPTEKEMRMIHSATRSFEVGEWAVRHSEYVVAFCGGTANFLLKGAPSNQFYTSAHEVASNFGLRAE